ALLIGLELGVVVGAFVDHRHEFAVDQFEVGAGGGTRRKARYGRGLGGGGGDGNVGHDKPLARRYAQNTAGRAHAVELRTGAVNALVRRGVLASTPMQWLEPIAGENEGGSYDRETLFMPSAEIEARTLVTPDQYTKMYQRSIEDPDGFWREQSKRLDWIKPPTKIKNTTFEYPNVSIKWFEDGVLNITANCIDRHLAKRGDQTAIIWEGDIPGTDEKITYRQLHERVCRFANVLKAQGVKKGDRVTIYMPMIPETAYA